MKYFTSTMWRSIQTTDPQKRAVAFDQWDKAWSQYRDYMESIRQKLSSKKWKTIMQCHDLHDCIIESISINNKQYREKNIVNIEIVLNDWILTFKNVTLFMFSIENQSAFPNGNYSWGYCEFELLGTRKMRISVLCDVDNQFVLEFEEIACQKR